MQRCIVQKPRRSIAFTAVFSPDDPVNSPSDRYVPGIKLMMMRYTLHVKSRSWISMTRSREMRCRQHARRGSRDVGPINSGREVELQTFKAKEGAESGEAKGLESSMLHSTAQSQISSISIHTSESVEQESSSPSTNKQLPN
ncbi:hypothetical protein NXS19_001364 [Fusarium pseudograminearum]|nr:hypothetical protein NXS19_001364 [Fusarium pseudograminearum]